MDMYVDSTFITRYTRIGSTTDMEFIDLMDEDGTGVNGEVITLVRVLDDEEWLIIIWVRFTQENMHTFMHIPSFDGVLRRKDSPTRVMQSAVIMH